MSEKKLTYIDRLKEQLAKQTPQRDLALRNLGQVEGAITILQYLIVSEEQLCMGEVDSVDTPETTDSTIEE